METDICENRHKGAATSRDAFEKIEPNLTKARTEVLLAVEKSGSNGITAKEYARNSGKFLNAVSGRFTELSRDGWIIRTDKRREGCSVWIGV